MANTTQAQALAESNANSVISRGINDIGNPYAQFFIRLMLAIGVVALLVLLSQAVSRFVAKRILDMNIQSNEYVTRTSKLVGDVVFWIMVGFSTLIGFQILGVDFSLMIGGISMGISVGLKDFLGNMIAGVLILTTKHYKLGDKVFIKYKKRWFWGKLTSVNIRYCVISKLDKRKTIIPNMMMVTHPVLTYSETGLVRLEAEFKVHYASKDLHAISDHIKDAINSMDRIEEKESTRVIVVVFAGSAITCKAYAYYTRGKINVYRATALLKKQIRMACKEHGISMPYNHLTVHVEDDDENVIGLADDIAAGIHNDMNHTDTRVQTV